MPRKGENIRKRKDGRWEGRYIKGYNQSTNRANYVSVYGKTYAEVKAKVNEAKYKTFIGVTYIDSKKRRFGDVLTEWMNLQKLHLKPASQIKYQNLINKHILPELGHIELGELSPSMLSNFLFEKSISGNNRNLDKGLSPSTLQTLQFLLNAVIAYAASINLITPFKVVHMTKKVRNRDVVVLEHEEERLLETYLSKHVNTKNIGIMLSLYCGLRIGEVCALKWADIDFTSQQLHVERTVQRLQKDLPDENSKTMLYIGTPKSDKSCRIIQLPRFLVPILTVLYQKSSHEKYIITNSETTPMEPRTYQYYFRAVLKESGIRIVNYHVLRHTFATNCIALKFDIKTLSEILGHSDVSMTLNKYVHPTDIQKQKQMHYWDNFKGQIYGQIC